MIAGYERHSPSSLNLFAASPSMFVLERVLGIKQPVGAPAHRGVAVEEGVTMGLVNLKASIPSCANVALTKFDTLTALSSDPRKEQYRKTIPDMVKAALEALREYGEPSSTQGFVEWKPDGLKLPIVGYYDYSWDKHGILGDLKTTEKMPSQIKVGHARQVALYAASDNVDARLIYVTPKRLEVYGLENVRRHREALRKIAKAVENFLSLSNDPRYFIDITCPDLDSFYWGTPPARQLAYDVWGI
jgi:PD-(D/E)XK nuclease superfamily